MCQWAPQAEACTPKANSLDYCVRVFGVQPLGCLSLFDAIGDGVWMIDTENKVVEEVNLLEKQV